MTSAKANDRCRTVLTKLALILLMPAFTGNASEAPDDRAEMESGFLPFIELAPMEVWSESMSVSVYARSKSDRRYAERFAEFVVEIAYETMGKSTGHGLVIVGDENEPHPLFVFRKFVEMARQGQISEELGASATELGAMLNEWEKWTQFGEDGDDGMDIDFEAIVPALPLPLEGVASKLFQVAWTEGFDDTRVEERLALLSAVDLESDELSRFDWVFYLPPKSAFSEVMKEVVPAFLTKEKFSLVQRMAIRSALTMFKPMVKGAFEKIREGVLFLTILRATSGYDNADIESLTEAYVATLVPPGAPFSSKRDRVIEGLEARKVEIAEFDKNPFVSPAPLTDFDPASYERFEGAYGHGRKTTHRFALQGETVTWQYLDWEPGVFLPAGDRLFVSGDGKMTIEFMSDESGAVTGVEERWARRRNWIPRKS